MVTGMLLGYYWFKKYALFGTFWKICRKVNKLSLRKQPKQEDILHIGGLRKKIKWDIGKSK